MGVVSATAAEAEGEEDDAEEEEMKGAVNGAKKLLCAQVASSPTGDDDLESPRTRSSLEPRPLQPLDSWTAGEARWQGEPRQLGTVKTMFF